MASNRVCSQILMLKNKLRVAYKVYTDFDNMFFVYHMILEAGWLNWTNIVF